MTRCEDVVGDGEVEAVLAAEIVGNRLKIDAGRLGDSPRRSALETEQAEDLDGGLDQPRPGGVAALRA